MSLAFLFPGQGSQSVGMAASLLTDYPEISKTFQQASDALGYDLLSLIQEGPAEVLNQTDKTQPAILTTGVAIWRVWQSLGGATPSYLAGHSLGEYTALVCAGSLDFEQAVTLVAARGRFMQEAVAEGEGAMAAILGLTDEEVISLCEDSAKGEVVSAVNFNSPGQVVIAGNAAAVDRAIGLAKEKGAKRALPLAVSAPSHCALMKPAALKLGKELDKLEVQAPTIPVIHNVDAKTKATPEAIKAALVEQLHNPVCWVDCIQAAVEMGADQFLECGPGKVLIGLNKRIDRTLISAALFNKETIEKSLG